MLLGCRHVDLPKTIAWHKLDRVNYAFAVPDEHGQLTSFEPARLRLVVEHAHRFGKPVSLSVGGWTGSVHLSSLVRHKKSRKAFANKLVEATHQYNLDGIDIDWEYPNSADGVSCNQNHPQDTENLLKFFKVLREKLDKKYPKQRKLITAAVGATVFNDMNQEPSKWLDRGFAKHVDAFAVMAYDLMGPTSEFTEANAGLRSRRGVSGSQAIQNWVSAGIPRDRILLGVPFYGYTTKIQTTINAASGMGVAISRPTQQIQGDQYDHMEKDPCQGAVAAYTGEYQWRSIAQDGILRNASGWHSYWDPVSLTPYAYNDKHQQFLTFDDPRSLGAKVQFVNNNQLGGIMLWSLEMDDAQHSLINALQPVRTNPL
ncbi:glycoside hydrolase [Radiomyces spectabilis]|uniref:glycoside hydrolase n=1 Tax=Radiomyces spectabilis TaxID=64574 RepID=UPI00222060E5|nr:glycoside hydrolase [Radiomyces spectabilis]KAI8391324.1 glycoside hydrolase [Radiomyces spectabilis]